MGASSDRVQELCQNLIPLDPAAAVVVLLAAALLGAVAGRCEAMGALMC